MKKIKIFLLLISIPCMMQAWNSSGHMTAGAVAYYYLKDHNPKVLEQVLTTLRMHPWYTTRWTDSITADGFTSEQKDIALFMYASTYADDARKIPELGGGEFLKWHYINYPFMPDNNALSSPPPPQSPNAEEKIIDLLSSIKTESNSSTKAIDICWLFHLIEDVHQPLHTVSLYDLAHAAGDRGGNETYIKENKNDSTGIKLHFFWDAIINDTPQGIPGHAFDLIHKKKYKLSKLDEIKINTTVHDWVYAESFEIAKKNAYRNGEINGTKQLPTLVSARYIKNAKAIGERRIVISGIRLANTLTNLYN